MMANADQQLLDQARSIQDASDMMTSYRSKNNGVVSYNVSNSIDWANVATTNPDIIDENGFIKGTSSTPQEMSDAVGSMAAYESWVEAGHAGNFDKVRSTQINKQWR